MKTYQIFSVFVNKCFEVLFYFHFVLPVKLGFSVSEYSYVRERLLASLPETKKNSKRRRTNFKIAVGLSDICF